MKITVQANQPRYKIRGGFGASWHAIEQGPRQGAGSAWGGNPPADDVAGWQQLYRHADYLGLSFLRVELEQAMYHPERDRLEFEWSPMQPLYRILDWCQRRDAGVFLQLMWTNVVWNAYPGEDPLHSAPLDLQVFADGLAALCRHLIRDRGYTCIRWLCITNEPGCSFSWWQGYGNQPLDIGPGLRAVRQSLDRLGIALPLAGPDYTGLHWKVQDFHSDELVGAYDLHCYLEHFGLRPLGGSEPERNLRRWVEFANARGKPFFLTEYGTMNFGWYGQHPGPGSLAASLANCEIFLRSLYAGVEGFNRWSFVNRGDLDGQWQLVDTWDVSNDRLLPVFTPHCPAYLFFALISRFLKRQSAVLTSADDAIISGWQQYFLQQAIQDPDGNITLFVLAYTEESAKLSIRLASCEHRLFFKYQLTPETCKRPPAEAINELACRQSLVVSSIDEIEDTIPGLSLTVYSSRRVEALQPVYE